MNCPKSLNCLTVFECVGLGQSETVRQLKQLTQLESRYEKP
jgi:hypothetical protein